MSTTPEPGPQHVGTLWLLDLSEPLLIGPLPRVEVHFQRAGSEAAFSLSQAMGFSSPEEVYKRLDGGKHCYIGIVDGILATYGRVTFDKELIGELRLHIHLPSGEAYIWDCATLPEYRVLPLYPSLVWHIVRDLQARGLKRI